MTDSQEVVNEIKEIHEEMKQKRHHIGASWDASALHNKQRRNPVNPTDGFLKKIKYRIYSISTKR